MEFACVFALSFGELKTASGGFHPDCADLNAACFSILKGLLLDGGLRLVLLRYVDSVSIGYILETVRFTISGGSDLVLTIDKVGGGLDHCLACGLCSGDDSSFERVLVISYVV